MSASPKTPVTKDGTPLTPEVIERLANEAEAGYDLAKARRVGRPSLAGGDEQSPHVSFRAPADLRRKAETRGAREGKTVSQLAREALEKYLDREHALENREDVVEVLEQFGVLLRNLSDYRDLSFAAASTLSRLQREGPARLTALAAIEGITQPSMTRLVHRLERLGLLTRGSDPEDARIVLLAITDAGRRLLADRRHARRDRLADLLATLSPEHESALVLAIHAALPAFRQLADNAARSRTPSKKAT
jgi:DNA-binding MarR family transcriptional regulator